MTPPFDLLPDLLRGLVVTVQVFLGASLLAGLIALLAGLCRLSPLLPVRWGAIMYIEVFRGTSAVVQLFWFYYVLPLFGVNLPAMTTGIVVLGLNYGAYGSEVVRGAVAGVHHGQAEAAVALNLTPWRRLRAIILPQAMMRMLPPMGNLQVELLKNTALVYFISLHDLTAAGKDLQNATQRTVEIFSLTLLIYFALAMIVSGATRYLESVLGRRWWKGGR